ncbi:MAG: HPF/RaiA family ribosome-associated protein [Phycisphaerales bacterium]|nr:HPF/RaiA family ribosome-associated protein [Phycisphaerales bacterium]MCB9854374.1 HPF/RaiA family ribosome-associated protein [Phycisphaerales bacterium]MCB9863575.1 HPF/RaiA family ribosome-associated protein [Phycisphaerales bacterium]
MVTKIMTKGFELSQGKRSLLEERILVGVRRYVDRISSVDIRLENSSNASNHWSCAITIDIDRGPQIDVAAQSDEREDSIEKAVHRAKDRLRKTLGEKSPLHDSLRHRPAMTS